MGLCLLLLGLSEVRVVPPPRSHLGICYLHSHTWEALSSDPSVAFVHPVSSARKQDWALTVVGAPFHFFFSNKGHFHSQFYLKYPLRGFLWRNSPFSWWGKHAELPALGRSQGRLCSLLLFVLGGSLIKGESIWWWLVICLEEEQRDVSKPQTSGWLPVGRLHSLGTQAGRRMLGWHQGLVCDTFTWVLPGPFGACGIPGAGGSSSCLALHQWPQICTSWVSLGLKRKGEEGGETKQAVSMENRLKNEAFIGFSAPQCVTSR